ncbi:hypothetical protein D3C75_815950 [compost metagenome]
MMQLNGLLVRNPALRKGEKVIDNAVGPVQLFHYDLIIRVDFPGAFLPHKLQESTHHRHWIADLMCNSRRHLPDQGQPLHIVQLAAELLFLCQVLDN